MRSVLLLALAMLAFAGPNAPENLKIDGVPSNQHAMNRPKFSWTVSHSERAQAQTAFRVRVYTQAMDTVWDSGRLESTATTARYSGRPLKPSMSYYWSVQWWDTNGVSAAAQPSLFSVAPDDSIWNSTVWIDGGNQLRRDFMHTDSASSVKIYAAGIGFFQLYVNGVFMNQKGLTGSWNTWTKRVLYHTFDITSVLQHGPNTIGVLLGAGWRDLSEFPPHPGGPCDSHERLLRVAVVADGRLLVGSDSTWNGTSSGPIVDDHVYNGETYDARKEMPGWAAPGFRMSPGVWTPATPIAASCFNPAMTPHTMPTIAIDVENKPVNIWPLDSCPSNVVGGMADENSPLTLTCASGTISDITFASFGTPSGACGSYQLGSCNSRNSMSVVRAACVGKSTCTIEATNDAFGGDPCFDTVKRLAVTASGCSGVGGTTYVVDFGENLSGWVRLRVSGAAGTTVTMHHAEVKQHPPYGPVDGSLYYGNLRSAKALDTYVLRGTPGGEVYEPHFTYHGFQFVEIRGFPGTLTKDSVTQVHFRTLNAVRTHWNSSSLVLNAIQDRALRGQGSNMMSVPTDCDQRDERLGWMGDAGLSADTMALNYDAEAFQTNFLRNMEDELYADGSLPDTVPWARYGGRPADPSWSAAFPQMAYAQAKYYGAIDTVREHWAGLELHEKFIGSQVAKYGGFKRWPTPYGDWVPAGPKVDNSLCSAFNYIVNTRELAYLAGKLNNGTAQAKYTALATDLVAQFNREYYHTSSKTWDNGEQSAQAMGLVAEAAPSGSTTDIIRALVHDITVTHNNHVTVGIIGAKALFPALTTGGENDVAVALAEQTTQPSWGYMIYNDVEPATASLWELWDSPTQGPGMNSRNHHMFSSISGWLVTSVAGVGDTICDADAPFALRAAPALAVSASTAEVDTHCGKLRLAYSRAGGVQCATVPEGRSLRHPVAPIVSGAELSCGRDGGVISAVEFASWGLPGGRCGAFVTNKTCHASAAKAAVEALCVGRQFCTVPADASFWSNARDVDADCGVAAHDLKRLAVQVRCSEAHRVHADVTVPVGHKATVALPTYGADMSGVSVSESGIEVFTSGAAVMHDARGVEDVAFTPKAVKGSGDAAGDHVTVTLASGSYSLRLSA